MKKSGLSLERHLTPRKQPDMRIITPNEVAKQAGNKYLGVLVAAKFARYLNEFPKDQLQQHRPRSSPPRRSRRWSTGT